MLDIYLLLYVCVYVDMLLYWTLLIIRSISIVMCYDISKPTHDLCSHTEREAAVQRWLWYAWQTLRSMLKNICQKPPGIIMQLVQMNAAPGMTIYWLTKGTTQWGGNRKPKQNNPLFPTSQLPKRSISVAKCHSDSTRLYILYTQHKGNNVFHDIYDHRHAVIVRHAVTQHRVNPAQMHTPMCQQKQLMLNSRSSEDTAWRP